MYYPSYQQVQDFMKQGEYDIIPLTKELYSDETTPLEVLRRLKQVSDHCYILESVEDGKEWGRYTFLGYQPKSEISCYQGILKVDGKTLQVEHPKTYIQQVLQKYKSPSIEGLPTFTGGFVGYFAYEYFRYGEPAMKFHAQDTIGCQDLDIMLFDKVICFDHSKQKIILIVNINTTNIQEEYEKGKQELETLMDIVLYGSKADVQPLELKSEFSSLHSKKAHMQMVEETKHYIQEGDIFQAVIANRFEAHAEGSLLDVYRVLRTTNPSPYMFYFASKQLEIAGASPETLVKVTDNKAYTFPLAGTRPRGKNREEDKRLQLELLQDQKELAEHAMLVDLARNDLGKVCKFGSVEVEKYQFIQMFSHVMHIASTVSGQVSKDIHALDVLDAILPAGTLSGAPKIRAMEIIDDLEKERRGMYGGAIGYIDFTGNLDTCIAIRFAYKMADTVYVHAGSGVVYDSDGETEYQECINKSKAVMEAIKVANGGLQK